ncbi:hypothetical protein AB5I41_21900 [Sphingomonas sp. MMS24-JH45]
MTISMARKGDPGSANGNWVRLHHRRRDAVDGLECEIPRLCRVRPRRRRAGDCGAHPRRAHGSR